MASLIQTVHSGSGMLAENALNSNPTTRHPTRREPYGICSLEDVSAKRFKLKI